MALGIGTPPPRAGQGAQQGKRRQFALALALGLSLIVPLALAQTLTRHTLSDLDLWLHDRAGTDLLREHALATHNTYSFTAPDYRWTDHEWLFQLGVALTAAGRNGAARAVPWSLACQALVAALVSVLWLDGAGPRPRNRLPSPGRAAALTLPLTGMLALAWPRLVLRPELPSLIAFALAVHWIGRAGDAGDITRGAAGGVPPPHARAWQRWRPLFSPRVPAGRTFWLALVWAQWHGFWILVPTLWLLAALLWPLERRLAPRRAHVPAPRPAAFSTPLGWLGPAVITLLAGALTPHGPAGLLYPLRALGQLGSGPDLRQTIAEMAPLLSIENRLGVTVLVFRICLVWATLWAVGTAGRVPPLRLALLAAGFGATFWAQRNLGFCAVAFMLAHGGYDPARPLVWTRRLASSRLRLLASRGARTACALPAVSLAIAILICAVWIPAIRDDGFYLREGIARRYGAGLAPAQFPFAAAAALRAAAPGAPPRVVNNIDAASTLIQARAGLVFIDGRTEVYPPEVWREYTSLRAGGDGALALLARRRADAVVLAHAARTSDRLITTLLASPRWRLAEADEAGVLFLPSPNTAPTGLPPDQLSPDSGPVLRAAMQHLLAELPVAGGGARAADRCLALGDLLRLGGLETEAETLFRRGLAARPDHPILLHNSGNQLLERGDLAGARARFAAAVAANGRLLDTRLSLGVCLFREGDVAGAAAQFGIVARRAPRRADAWANLGEARLRLGDRAGARTALARAVALNPADPRLRRRLADLGG
jgi:tetratricopeptide (TPR) repeat protein